MLVSRSSVGWLDVLELLVSQREREDSYYFYFNAVHFCRRLPFSFRLPSAVVRLLPAVCLRLPPPVVRQLSLTSVFVVRLLVNRLRPSSARRLSSTVIRQFVTTARLQRHLQRFAQLTS